MNAEARIQQLVNDFVAQVTQAARQAAAETLASALAGAVPTTATASVRRVRVALTTGRAARAGGKRSVGLPEGAKRAASDIERLKKRFLDHVKANPGQRVEQINRTLGTRTAELRLPLAKLIAGKLVRAKGHKRSTKYFAVE